MNYRQTGRQRTHS